jgi:arsenate reductase
MAEGIARAIAPPEVVVSSAGSEPAAVRPEAIAVLAEIGIDISDHQSKSIDDIDAGSVEVVVTLCAEEVCPAYLGYAERLQWPMADPAAVGDDEATRLEAYRAARDVIKRRIEKLFEEWQLRLSMSPSRLDID